MAHDHKPVSENENGPSSRRQFMTRTASTVAGAALVPRHVLGGRGVTPPSDRLNVAMIGTGGQGMQNLRNLLEEEDVRIVAIADTGLLDECP